MQCHALWALQEVGAIPAANTSHTCLLHNFKVEHALMLLQLPGHGLS